ncbi:MAG: L-threonate dehydrogenase [Paracoccaceae bacterium]
MKPEHIGIVGLGSMGFGIARSCLSAGLSTIGFDLDAAKEQELQTFGARAGTLLEAAPDLTVLILVVVNGAQAEAILFGDNGIAEHLNPDSVVIGCPTISPDVAQDFETRLSALGIHYLDAPISGGSLKADAGALTIMASGTPLAFERSETVLTAISEHVFRLGDTAGAGSAMKVVNQLLAGVHIAAAAEAIAFGMTQGIAPDLALDVISRCAGTSWMFENRVPHIVDGDYTPRSAIDIFVKDLGIVTNVAKTAGLETPLALSAFTRFQAAQSAGLGRQDDAAVIKTYAAQAGLKLPGES